MRTCRCIVFVFLPLLCWAGVTCAVETPLVSVEAGNLPIILSAPHGGSEPIPGVSEREGKGVRQFVKTMDYRTDHLTEELADALEKRTGKRPYVVIARFHRKYIDANRPAERAYESDAAKPVYDAYHAAVAQARSDVTRRWGKGILFDVHGQGREKETIYRGTQHGKTVKHLVGRFGENALIGKDSVFGQLAAEGITVHPLVGSTDREASGYSGGYIVGAYGSRDGGTIDAIQFELGRALRDAKASKQTAEKMADAIVAFSAKYLPELKQAPREPLRVGVYTGAGARPSHQASVRSLEVPEASAVRD